MNLCSDFIQRSWTGGSSNFLIVEFRADGSDAIWINTNIPCRLNPTLEALCDFPFYQRAMCVLLQDANNTFTPNPGRWLEGVAKSNPVFSSTSSLLVVSLLSSKVKSNRPLANTTSLSEIVRGRSQRENVLSVSNACLVSIKPFYFLLLFLPGPSGSPSPSPWWRKCRSLLCSWALSSWWPAYPGYCGRHSAHRRCGSGGTCCSRSAMACMASWTWCASVSSAVLILTLLSPAEHCELHLGQSTSHGRCTKARGGKSIHILDFSKL